MIYVLSGGGTGGTLVVTGVAGDTVTATKDGKSYKRTFNASGIATFKGLKTGTWALTMTDGSQSVTQNVTINADYTLTMAYFSALITTTWPEGSTCSCTDGTSTLYAPDTSGSYTFNVPNKGTWTVTATNGDKTASKSVSITAEGQTVAIGLNYALYDAGDENENLTGGWELINRSTGVAGSKTATALVSGNTTIYLQNIFYTVNVLDLSGYSTLKATITVKASSGSYPDEQFAAIGVTSTDLSQCTSGSYPSTLLKYGALFDVAGAKTTTVGSTTLFADISAVSSGTVVLSFGWTTGSCSKIWLE